MSQLDKQDDGIAVTGQLTLTVRYYRGVGGPFLIVDADCDSGALVAAAIEMNGREIGAKALAGFLLLSAKATLAMDPWQEGGGGE